MGPLRCPWHLRCWGHDIEAVVVLVNIPRPSRGIRVSAGLRAPKILMPPPARASDIGCTRSADTWKRRVTQWCVGEPAGWGPPNVTGPAGRASACRGLPPVANSPMCDDVIAYPYAPKGKQTTMAGGAAATAGTVRAAVRETDGGAPPQWRAAWARSPAGCLRSHRGLCSLHTAAYAVVFTKP